MMGRNMKLRIMDEHGVERANHKLDYGSKLFVKKGQVVDVMVQEEPPFLEKVVFIKVLNQEVILSH